MALTTMRIGLASVLFGSMVAVTGSAAADNEAPVPELSGHWGRSNFNLEQPPNGPKFISNTLKKKDGTTDDDAGRVGRL